MAEFMGVHELPESFEKKDVQEGWNKYKAAAVKMGLRPIRAHYNLEKRVAYCETEAQSEAEVRAAHADADVPLKDVIKIETVV